MIAPHDWTLPELCRLAALRWPERVALHCEDGAGVLTFAQLDRAVRQVATELVRRGVRPGDRIAVSLPNRIQFPVLWLAITAAGGVMVPVNPAYRSDDLAHLIRHSGAIAFMGMRGSKVDLPTGGWAEDADALLAAASTKATAPLPAIQPEWPANIQYTSGTTGLPKGCVLSHRYWVNFGRCFVDQGPRLTSDDTVLTAQAFSYADPQWNVVASLLSGATLVILERFSPSRFWSRVCEHGVTFFYCLGAMPTLLLKMPPDDAERRHRVRMVVCSGIPRDRHAELERRFGAPWLEAYGTTETGGDLMVPLEEHEASIGTGHLGRPMAGKEIRILDDGGGQVPVGAVGELCIRGVGMMDRYHDDPVATATAFRDGWYHTGDRVSEDQAGRIVYVSRIKDMVRRGGENISAAEVEAALQSHPQVRIAACIAVPDELRGEEAKAFIVPNQFDGDPDVLLRDVAAFLALHLAEFKIPRYWEAVTELPMTVSDKVAKSRLREQETVPPRGWDRRGQPGLMTGPPSADRTDNIALKSR